MSTVFVDTIKNQAGTTSLAANKLPDMLSGSAKAWVVFDGSGTVSVGDSLNNSSITDNGTGDYTNNFSNAFSSVNYTHFAGGEQAATLLDAVTVSSSEVSIYNFANNSVDRTIVCLLHHGDLA